MTSAKPICTPLTTSIHLIELNVTQLESEREYMSCVPYASVVGSLMYAMVCTRPDLTQVVNVVSRYMGKFGK